ncbi:Uncharacterised protein [Mycolicibacter terrae]|nr:Uncharacterised protein [Mycolicibacter terrae]
MPHERADRSAYNCSIHPHVAGAGGICAGAATRATCRPLRS